MKDLRYTTMILIGAISTMVVNPALSQSDCTGEVKCSRSKTCTVDSAGEMAWSEWSHGGTTEARHKAVAEGKIGESLKNASSAFCEGKCPTSEDCKKSVTFPSTAADAFVFTEETRTNPASGLDETRWKAELPGGSEFTFSCPCLGEAGQPEPVDN